MKLQQAKIKEYEIKIDEENKLEHLNTQYLNTAETLMNRVLKLEHQAYPEAIKRVFSQYVSFQILQDQILLSHYYAI